MAAVTTTTRKRSAASISSRSHSPKPINSFFEPTAAAWATALGLKICLCTKRAPSERKILAVGKGHMSVRICSECGGKVNRD